MATPLLSFFSFSYLNHNKIYKCVYITKILIRFFREAQGSFLNQLTSEYNNNQYIKKKYQIIFQL